MVNRLERNFLTLSSCNQMFLVFFVMRKGKRQTKKCCCRAEVKTLPNSTRFDVEKKMLNYLGHENGNSAYRLLYSFLPIRFIIWASSTCLTARTPKITTKKMITYRSSFLIFFYIIDESWAFSFYFLSSSSTFPRFSFVFDFWFIRIDILWKSTRRLFFYCLKSINNEKWVSLTWIRV